MRAKISRALSCMRDSEYCFMGVQNISNPKTYKPITTPYDPSSYHKKYKNKVYIDKRLEKEFKLSQKTQRIKNNN